jgi:uncharacterized protein involved in type VI secretion and phage assembly
MSLNDLTDSDSRESRRRNRINGIVPAIVTNNQDPDGLGRVKVRFPWLSEENESDWAKVMTFMAGDGRGGYFLPEVGDEVLVAFEHGDINYPYVLGSVWNAEDAPPETNGDGNNNIRKITSRSGHEIVLNDDAQGQSEKIEIHTNAGHRITMDDSAGQEKIEIVDKSGNNTVVIDSVQNSIAIESALTLNIKAETISIEANASMEIKSNGNLTIQGTLVRIN